MSNEVILKMRNVSIERNLYSYGERPIVELQGEILEQLDVMPTPGIKKVIFNTPATIILWNDGTKTVSKCHNEKFDKEKGFAMAVAKKAVGSYAKMKIFIGKADKQNVPYHMTAKGLSVFIHDEPDLEKSEMIMRVNRLGESFSNDGGKTWHKK